METVVPDELEFALETMDPLVAQDILNDWRNLSDDEREQARVLFKLDSFISHFYNKRLGQLGI